MKMWLILHEDHVIYVWFLNESRATAPACNVFEEARDLKSLQNAMQILPTVKYVIEFYRDLKTHASLNTLQAGTYKYITIKG